jgi:hypothetical protein
MFENVPESFVPIVLTPAIIPTTMRAAIKPYSIAVAPDSLEINFLLYSYQHSSFSK